jgi:hypothetical protein
VPTSREGRERPGLATGASRQIGTATNGPVIIAYPPVAAYQRDARRRLAVELAAGVYGPAALLGPSRPGPRACPPWCPWCRDGWPTDWWGRCCA